MRNNRHKVSGFQIKRQKLLSDKRGAFDPRATAFLCGHIWPQQLSYTRSARKSHHSGFLSSVLGDMTSSKLNDTHLEPPPCLSREHFAQGAASGDGLSWQDPYSTHL